MSNDENIVKIINEVRYDAMAPGNYDFNYGANTLGKLKEQNVDYIVGLGHLGIYQESAPYRLTDIINQVEALEFTTSD